MNVKIKTVYGELSFNMTQDNALALISAATKYADAYEGDEDQPPVEVFMDSHALANAVRPAYTDTKPNAYPLDKTAPKSRLESIFGKRSEWNIPDNAQTAAPPAAEPTDAGTDALGDGESEGYKGFMYIKCEECGVLKGFHIKQPLHYHKCECGHKTELRNLRAAHVKCECGSRVTYNTNIKGDAFTINCFLCGSPVDMELGSKGTAFVTIREDYGGRK